MHRTLSLVLLLFAACGCSLPYERGLETAGYRTLWVENQTLHSFALYMGPQLRRIGWVQAGRGSCIRLRVHTTGSVRYGIRPGSYQVESAFSRRIGYGQSYPT